MSSVGNRTPEMFLQRLILPVNGGKVGSAYETGFRSTVFKYYNGHA